MDVWLGWLVPLRILEGSYEDTSVLLQSGRRYMLTGKDCLPQCGYNDFEVRERRSRGYFMIAACS